MVDYIELADGWKMPVLGADEEDRMKKLQALDILDSDAEEDFDQITRTVGKMMDVQIALVSLVDEDRQWFKSCYGIDARQTSREQSFCAHIVAHPEILYVPDATKDERFRNNTLVTGEPHIRLYLGAPLRTKDGAILGSLCAIDNKVRHDITDEQIYMLQTLANLAVSLLELRISNKKIEAANKSKSAFFASMSHEIRTPMNGILCAAQLLTQTKLDELQKKYLDSITGSGNMLLEIINEILEFAKIESGAINLNEKAIDLKDVIKDQLSLLKSLAEEKNIICNISFDEGLETNQLLDETKFRQILTNLVGNAIKFTGKNGSVNINCSAANSGFMKIAVEDNGIGIDPKNLETIFVAYEQALNEPDGCSMGTGLGLAITKKLVDIMGGRIHVESKQDHGSVFAVELPVKYAEQSDVQKNKPAAHNDSRTQLNKKVLLVEDVETNQFLIGSLLESIGCEVDIADNGQQALNKVQATDFDVILMDCHIPIMDGYETTREIRKLTKRQPRILALTANAFKEDEEKCLNAGMDGFLRKPIEMNKFIQALSA